MTDVANVKITLDLSYHEARLVRASLEGRRKKFERAARKEFTPEAGKIDRNQAGIEQTTELIDRINTLLDEAIAEQKE